MTAHRPLIVFWCAVVVDVAALGVAWSAWPRALGASEHIALVIAVPATFAGLGASLIAGRILAVLLRAGKRAA